MDILDWTKTFAYHRGMLEDRPRVDRYREAIHAVVQPGDVVLDIGTGTGILSYFACQAGARHVYALEAARVVSLARELCRANGFDDRITFINEMSYRATLPERADVLVTETLWSFGIGEGMVGFLADARDRLLKPGARVVPESVDLFLAPVEMGRLHDAVTKMPEDRHGLDFSVIRSYAVNQIQVPFVDAGALLSEPAHLVHVELDPEAKADFSAEATVTATRAGTVHALAGWFEAELAPGIRLGNPPGQPSNWAQAVFPIETAVPVEPGDEIAVRIETVANGTVWRWSTTVGERRFDQTSMFAFPHDTAAHRRRAGAACPGRAPAGDAMLFVLDQLDGETPIDDIAQRLSAALPGLFGEHNAADQFVRDVAERYGA